MLCLANVGVQAKDRFWLLWMTLPGRNYPSVRWPPPVSKRVIALNVGAPLLPEATLQTEAVCKRARETATLSSLPNSSSLAISASTGHAGLNPYAFIATISFFVPSTWIARFRL